MPPAENLVGAKVSKIIPFLNIFKLKFGETYTPLKRLKLLKKVFWNNRKHFGWLFSKWKKQSKNRFFEVIFPLIPYCRNLKNPKYMDFGHFFGIFSHSSASVRISYSNIILKHSLTSQVTSKLILRVKIIIVWLFSVIIQLILLKMDFFKSMYVWTGKG